MKKILLIVCLILAIFQLVVLATDIDIGSPAINRDDWGASGYTIVEKTNPANTSGKITSIEIWAVENLANCEVAIFYVVSGNNLSTRSNITIGSVTAGAKQTFTKDSSNNDISMDVNEGDYIGIYFTSGQLEREAYQGTGLGFWTTYADAIPCTNREFSFNAAYLMKHSLYGTGETAAEEGSPNILFIFQNF